MQFKYTYTDNNVSEAKIRTEGVLVTLPSNDIPSKFLKGTIHAQLEKCKSFEKQTIKYINILCIEWGFFSHQMEK